MSRTFIGFDRALRLDWLDRTASLAARGFSLDEARSQLREELQDDLEGDNAVVKTVRVMQRVWFPDDHLQLSLRKDALALLTQVSGSERIAIHWSLTLAAYPFFFDSVETIGRLSRLQSTFTGVQVQDRIATRWGDREIVSRARRHVLQTLTFWNVLDMLNRSGEYAVRDPIVIRNIGAERLLAASVLAAASADAITEDDVLTSPALFPFAFAHSSTEVFADPSFAVWVEGSLRRSVALAN